MKLTSTVFLLAFVAVTASVVYAAPQGDDDEEIAIQEFLEKAMKQSPQEDDDGEEELQAELQSLIAETEEADKERAELQNYFAQEQAPARMQWRKRSWRKVWRLAKRIGRNYIRHYVGKRSTEKIQKK